MALDASGAGPGVTASFAVLVVHRGLLVLVAMSARCNRKIIRYPMALGASQSTMRTARDVKCVTKRCVVPRICVVTGLTSVGKIRGRVIGIGCILVARRVATEAVVGQTRVDVVLVTGGASDGRVGAGQRELGMNESRALPAHGRMTRFAVGRKARAGMVGHGRVLILGRMTGKTILRQALELLILVTLRAVGGRVGADQRESLVTELGVLPSGRGVTLLTVLRPTELLMVGQRRAGKVLLMAKGALIGCARKVSDLGTGMTAEASHAGVYPN